MGNYNVCKVSWKCDANWLFDGIDCTIYKHMYQYRAKLLHYGMYVDTFNPSANNKNLLSIVKQT